MQIHADGEPTACRCTDTQIHSSACNSTSSIAGHIKTGQGTQIKTDLHESRARMRTQDSLLRTLSRCSSFVLLAQVLEVTSRPQRGG